MGPATAATLGAAGVAANLLVRPPAGVVSLVARACPRVLLSVATERPVVALSLDDGPHPTVTPRVLDVLAAYGARATFFAIGSRAAAHPELVARAVAEGHELGNHTWQDEPSWRLPAAGLAASLRRTRAALPADAEVRLFRPGSGWPTGRVLTSAEAQGYRCALGSVYPLDGCLRAPRYARWDVLRRVRPGAIVILHEGTAERRDVVWVLEEVLSELGRRGWRVTTISELVRAARD